MTERVCTKCGAHYPVGLLTCPRDGSSDRENVYAHEVAEAAAEAEQPQPLPKRKPPASRKGGSK